MKVIEGVVRNTKIKENDEVSNDVSVELYSEVPSIADILEIRASLHPDKTCFTYMKNGDEIDRSVSFLQLHNNARGIAKQLVDVGAQNERVLILLLNGVEYVEAFFACLYSQSVAVPLYPPRDNSNLRRIIGVFQDNEPKAIITTSSVYERIRVLSDQQRELGLVINKVNWILIDQFKFDGTGYKSNDVGRSDLAFLQYTSGATSSPKGVMVSHGNILHNQAVIKKGVSHTMDTVLVTWLPIFHDMGLIGTILPCIYNGISGFILSPADFLRRPIRWMKVIAEQKATFTGAPNFAYDLCVKRITDEQAKDIDISSLQYLFNGAEPIKPQTLKRFSEKFSACGFKARVFFPCYGMAETTLIVTGKTIGDDVTDFVSLPNPSKTHMERQPDMGFMSCGRSWLDDEVAIVNTKTRERCIDGDVGEIWVKGKSVALGYWNNEKETSAVFDAQIANTESKGYFRTGDLGFMRAGYLYATGRIKDVIIVNGKNYYPQDIELVVEQELDGIVTPNTSAAFTLAGRNNELLVVSEVERTARKNTKIDIIAPKLSNAIFSKIGLVLAGFVLIRPNTALKTSSGKVQRSATEKVYLDNKLAVISSWVSDKYRVK